MSYLTGRSGGSGSSGSKDSTREAIVNLREHLLMLDKKEEHLTKKIEEELRKAKGNATTNPRGRFITCSGLQHRLTITTTTSGQASVEAKEVVRE